MPFKLLPATLSDAEIIGAIQLQSSTSPRLQLEFQNCDRDAWLNFNVQCIRQELEVCAQNPGELSAMKCVFVEEGEEEIAGYAVWGWSEQAASLLSSTSKFHIPLPARTNTALHTLFHTTLRTLESTHSPSTAHYILLNLFTSPNFQRRGIGRLLVEHGLLKADRNGMQVFLSASPMGVLLYRKLGFGEKGRLEIPLGEWGGEEGEVHVHVAMIREPEVEGRKKEE